MSSLNIFVDCCYIGSTFVGVMGGLLLVPPMEDLYNNRYSLDTKFKRVASGLLAAGGVAAVGGLGGVVLRKICTTALDHQTIHEIPYEKIAALGAIFFTICDLKKNPNYQNA